ncbi:MAG: hypothetical protein L6Q57_01030 [Alphaproteobacteria bacterium]|nr:hypothetical protein [Alphaproteobacteria bacterium]
MTKGDIISIALIFGMIAAGAGYCWKKGYLPKSTQNTAEDEPIKRPKVVFKGNVGPYELSMLYLPAALTRDNLAKAQCVIIAPDGQRHKGICAIRDHENPWAEAGEIALQNLIKAQNPDPDLLALFRTHFNNQPIAETSKPDLELSMR